jgi:hypothetical protein
MKTKGTESNSVVSWWWRMRMQRSTELLVGVTHTFIIAMVVIFSWLPVHVWELFKVRAIKCYFIACLSYKSIRLLKFLLLNSSWFSPYTKPYLSNLTLCYSLSHSNWSFGSFGPSDLRVFANAIPSVFPPWRMRGSVTSFSSHLKCYFLRNVLNRWGVCIK